MQENIQSPSDDEPLFSKNEIREIRLAMKGFMDENEELRSKIIAMDAMVKNREATLKKAYAYIKFLEQRYQDYELWNINLN
jgi:sulfur relay (sulfurtransferase) DsrC/TusE family protein